MVDWDGRIPMEPNGKGHPFPGGTRYVSRSGSIYIPLHTPIKDLQQSTGLSTDRATSTVHNEGLAKDIEQPRQDLRGILLAKILSLHGAKSKKRVIQAPIVKTADPNEDLLR